MAMLRKRSKYCPGRKYNTRPEKKIIYIFTDGEKTEVNYFKAKKNEIRRTNIQIKIKGTANNTLSLVEYAMAVIANEGIVINGSEDGDECWVVFDKDNFDNFDEAIIKASQNGLRVAYSNECFELWFFLHFCLITAGIGRQDYMKKLDNKLKKLGSDGYKKNSLTMYSLIKNLEVDAINNARYLLDSYPLKISYSKKNPSTTVHLLVERLNKFK